MPSSMIFAGLVVIWLLILVPAVARHRQEVERPSVAALSGRVVERPRRHRNTEVDMMHEVDPPRSVATRPDREAVPRVPAARSAVEGPDPGSDDGVAVADDRDGRAGDQWADDGETDDRWDDNGRADDRWADDGRAEPDHRADGRGDHPARRYRPGRGGFDPEAAALAARARYTFRQRVVLALLLGALGTGVVAAVTVAGMWWLHGAVDLVLVAYLVNLRRQVRTEEAIRRRRAARMAGTRRPPPADPEIDDEPGRSANHEEQDGDVPDDLDREEPERVPGAGRAPGSAAIPLAAGCAPTAAHATAAAERAPVGNAAAAEACDAEPALPRLAPAPPPALPPGTALVDADDADPDLLDLDGPARPGYRRAAGE